MHPTKGVLQQQQQKSPNKTMIQPKISTYEVWRTFKETTTAHGIPHLARAQGPVKKAFWGLMLLATVAALLFNISSISMQFFSYPVIVSIKLLHETELTFPSVTVCNMNPVRKSAWEQAVIEQAGIGGLQNDATQNRKRRKKRALSDNCPSGWTNQDGFCYNLLMTSVTYAAARTACSGAGGYLVSVLSAAEQAAVQSLVPAGSSNMTVWLGLGFSWFWVDGRPVTAYNIINWSSFQPSGDGYCVHTYGGGDWNDRKCTGAKEYVCEKPMYPDGTCDAGAVSSDVTKTCYVMFNVTTKMETAQSNCQSIGGHLIVVKSPHDSEVVKNLTLTFTDRFWIGLRLLPGWADGHNVSYTNWAASEPNNSSHQCAVMNTTDGKWTTADCTSPAAGYVCKKQEVTTTAEPTKTTAPPKGSNAASSNEPSCCCSCCYHNSDGTIRNCGSCGTGCLSNSIASLLNLSDATVAPPAEPQPIPGSKFPERVQTRESYQKTEAVTETLAEMSDTSKELLGYMAEDFIVDCEFAGADCSILRFQKFYNPVHGNCFIFNSGWNDSVALQESYKTGRRHGLQLILNIDQDEYIKESGDTAGARLVVHTQSSMPFPEDEGITVTPGQATSVGVRLLMINRLGRPHGECIDSKDVNADQNAFIDLFPVGYRPTACAKTCYQKNVIESCDCADPYYPISERAFGRQNISVCKTSNITQDDCRYSIKKQFERNELKCDCPNACNETIFALSASTAEWPSDVQKTNMLTKFYQKAPSLFSDPTDPEKYKRNLLKVEVFYEEFNFELMQEKPAYYDSNYMSDLGGVLGLWLGCSILTLIEFIEFLMDLVAVRAMGSGYCAGSKIKEIKVAPSPSPNDQIGYDDKQLKDKFAKQNDFAQFPAAFRGYIEENRLEQEAHQRMKAERRNSFSGICS